MSFWHKLGKMQSCRSRLPRRCGILPHPVDAASSPRPPRLRRGVTLVELMIAMLILAIVCVAWLEIIGIQSAKREARRREAVERLAGMMDAFMVGYKINKNATIVGFPALANRQYYEIETANELLSVKIDPNKRIVPFVPDLTAIGYKLYTVTSLNLPDRAYFGTTVWGNAKFWLVGELYDVDKSKPFFRIPVYLGIK